MSALDQQRREIERRRRGDPAISVCQVHGAYEGEVCLTCYSEQQERVERESISLRYANTASALRARVLAELAERNGA